VPKSRHGKFDEREIVVREIPRFFPEEKGLSQRDNFAGLVPIVQQVVSLAQRDRVLPSMSVKIKVAGAEIDIEVSSLQGVASEEKQDWTWCSAESRSGSAVIKAFQLRRSEILSRATI
jgi:hypothetical protein